MGRPVTARVSVDPPRASQRSIQSLQRELNVLRGIQAEQQTNQTFGGSIIGRQVTVETSSGLRSRFDNLLTGRTVLETKSSTTARFTRGQKALISDIVNGRPVTPVGRNAARAGLQVGVPTTFNGYAVTVPSAFPW